VVTMVMVVMMMMALVQSTVRSSSKVCKAIICFIAFPDMILSSAFAHHLVCCNKKSRESMERALLDLRPMQDTRSQGFGAHY
jgi:hypothetical protein